MLPFRLCTAEQCCRRSAVHGTGTYLIAMISHNRKDRAKISRITASSSKRKQADDTPARQRPTSPEVGPLPSQRIAGRQGPLRNFRRNVIFIAALRSGGKWTHQHESPPCVCVCVSRPSTLRGEDCHVSEQAELRRLWADKKESFKKCNNVFFASEPIIRFIKPIMYCIAELW